MDRVTSSAVGGAFGTGLAGTRLSRLSLAALCGLGLATSVVTLARAADDSGILETIRYDAVRRLARAAALRDTAGAATNRREAYADGTLPQSRPVARRARVKLSGLGASVMGRRTLCVRTCDGYAFPIAPLRRSADLPAHKQACEASCPGAPTALYTLGAGRGLDATASARSVADGSPYRRLQTAFLFQKTRVASCSCQGPDQIAKRVPILLDSTLRAGDAVVDRRGDAKVFAGGTLPHAPRDFTDYRRSPAIGRTARTQIDRAVGTSQREALARDFRRDLRVRQAALAQKRQAALAGMEAKAAVPTRYASLREVAAPAGSAANVRAYAFSPAAGAVSASAPRIIEIR